MPHDVTLLRDIALGIVFAVIAGHVARLLGQPLILGYIAGGVLLSPRIGFGLVQSEASIELISEIGLILLLFIIGLEIDLREIRRLGRSLVVLGVGQFSVDALLGLAVFAGLGYRWGSGNFDLLYLAIVAALSSTLIVVKLLRDKFELKVLSGRLTLGVLVFQDLWAILFMALQPHLADPGLLGIVQSIAGSAVLVAVAFLASRYLLAGLFEAAAARPELVLLSAVAWCFIMSGVAERLGLSREMGALIAGVSISAFPYGADVIAKITGVRDFFVTLFFVALGMNVPLPTLAILGPAFLIVAFVFVSRLVAVVPLVYVLGDGLYAGLVTALNLAQISEFSLVILKLGSEYGHISPHVNAVVLTAMILTSLISTYVIGANDRLARLLLRPFARPGPGPAPAAEPEAPGRVRRDIVLLGHFRIAQAVLDLVEQRAPHLKERITLIDYHATRGRTILARGFHWQYGDLANPDTLEHLGIEHARFIVTTISDTFLKGISTRRLVAHLRRLAPTAIIVMTGEERDDAEDLQRGGADHVLIPGEITGERLIEILGGNGPAR
ncbi:MAG TPA: cation:proton antiporter [Candidatus Binatia bacterium]|nr:cation:proton antiporter [Candidatus Binatia bacterium]